MLRSAASLALLLKWHQSCWFHAYMLTIVAPLISPLECPLLAIEGASRGGKGLCGRYVVILPLDN